jgi:chorismate mutase
VTAAPSPAAPFESWGVPRGRKLLIAGPCSAESPEQLLRTAEGLRGAGIHALRAGIWKPRTRPGHFEGRGAPALAWLVEAGKAIGVPVATEVAEARHVERCLKQGIDILWVGARSTGNPFTVQAIADALRGVDVPVLVKNPVSPDIELWIGAVERLHRAGVRRLAAVHRGFGSSLQTVFRNSPQWRIPLELRTRLPGIPLICDPSHICGSTRLLAAVAQEAMDLLFDGLMIEVHHRPSEALSDAAQQITPAEFRALVGGLQTSGPALRTGEQRAYFKALRARIDRIDAQIIALLGRRMGAARRLGVFKRRHGVSLFQPGRYAEVLKSRVAEGAKFSLEEEFVTRIYQHIHEEALRHQEASGMAVDANAGRPDAAARRRGGSSRGASAV